MWCDFGKSRTTTALICVVTVSAVIAGTAFAARQRNYKPAEFRAVLHGLGYNVKLTGESLTDEETKKAITEFQKGYRLNADGIAGPKTQNFAATIIQILQGNLNAVLKPNPLLPRDQFYSPKIEELVKEYQKKNQLTETGVADLRLRQKLNEDAKTLIASPTTSPTAKPTTSPMAKPSAKPTTSPMAKPSAKPTAKPTTSPMAKPTAKPTTSPMAKPSAKPTAKPTTSPMGTPSPTPTTSPTATP